MQIEVEMEEKKNLGIGKSNLEVGDGDREENDEAVHGSMYGLTALTCRWTELSWRVELI